MFLPELSAESVKSDLLVYVCSNDTEELDLLKDANKLIMICLDSDFFPYASRNSLQVFKEKYKSCQMALISKKKACLVLAYGIDIKINLDGFQGLIDLFQSIISQASNPQDTITLLNPQNTDLDKLPFDRKYFFIDPLKAFG